MKSSVRIAVAALALLCSHLPASAQQLIPFRVGITDAVNTVLPVWMAEEGGFYAANGLKVEIINMGGGTRGAKELQAGNIDLMRVGMSSVVQANTSGGDLRLIGSMSNVIRFVIATAPGVKTAADLKGGVIGVSTLRLGKRFHRDAGAGALRHDARRRDGEGIWRRRQAARGGARRRDQGDRDQRADHQPGARAGRQHPDRSRRREDPVAVQRRGGAARRPQGAARPRAALHARRDRGQLSGADRRRRAPRRC